MMRFSLITLFPDACDAYLNASIIGRARKEKKISISYQNPRDFVENKWGKVDERPYGGGPGMVVTALPVIKAVEKALNKKKKSVVIWFSPSAKQFTNKDADALAKYDDIILVCGRYEGIDARVKKAFKMEDISVGPFVLTGGELPAMLVIDSVARRLPGVLGDINSLEESRVACTDVYTRPEVIDYKGKKVRVPKILLSGDRAKINEWKKGRGKK